MDKYDPELNPGKTLEETMNNFIAWIRDSNRGQMSLLRNISDRYSDISKTEENLKLLEKSQTEVVNQPKIILESLNTSSEKGDSQDDFIGFTEEVRLAVDSASTTLTKMFKELTESVLAHQEAMESEYTQSMNKIEEAILDIKSDIVLINSQLKVPPKKTEVKPVTRDFNLELARIQQQITCKTEQDKATILEIINNLINDLSNIKVEFSGLEVKKRLISARMQVYDRTEGLAPRFRKMMDNLMGVINEESSYSSGTLDPLIIEGIRNIREIYHSAPVG